MFAQSVLSMLFVITGILCCTDSNTQKGEYTHLKKPALEQAMQFVSADQVKEYVEFMEIPAEDWVEEIVGEHPVKVYVHYNNIVLIFELGDKFEKGIYIYLPHSSYRPQDTVKMEFTEIEPDIYNFSMQID